MMTLSKIAKLAHVSVSTASKAFSMSPEVNEETREAIFKIAKEHKCFKKFYNAKYPKLVISVICPEFLSQFYTLMLGEIKVALSKHNCEMIVSSTGFSDENEKSFIEYYTNYSSVDGILVIERNGEIYKDGEIPIVYITNRNKADNESVIDYITEIIGMAIDHFVNNNVKSIGFIGEANTWEKLNSFKKAMELRNLEINENHISISDKRFEKAGYDAMKSLIMNNEKLPRAIITAYDYMAIGAIRCMHENGIRVPKDIAVISMDDIHEAKYLIPSLSSINMNITSNCEKAVNSLINQILGNEVDNYSNVKPKLILRESSIIE